jgi:myo-inositol 2-dehydrogenase/D-chiro-inositol 1-dehydrogenase
MESLRVTPRKAAILTYVVDINGDRAKEVADDFSCGWSTSLTDDIMEKIDALIVASTTDTHFAFVKKGLLAGKCVFTEKPISHNPHEVKEVLDLAKRSTKPFVVGYQRRCDKNYRALRNEVRNLGDVRMIKCCSRDNPFPPMEYLRTSGGIFHDMLSHDFDMIHYLSGQFPVSVYSVGHAYKEEIREMDDVDTVCVVMKFRSGMIAVVDSSRISEPGYDQRVEVFGAEGVAYVRNVEESTVQVGTSKGFLTPKAQNSFPERYKETYSQELAEFINMCAREYVEEPELIDRHLQLEKICMAAEFSCRLKREVKMSEVDDLYGKPHVKYDFD